MPSKHEALVKYVTDDLLSGIKGVTAKRMFGGHGFYSGGKMFGLEADGEIFFKVNKETQSDFEQAGSHPFQYSSKDRKAVTMSYWSVPDEVMENPDEAVKWARRAIKVALSA